MHNRWYLSYTEHFTFFYHLNLPAALWDAAMIPRLFCITLYRFPNIFPQIILFDLHNSSWDRLQLSSLCTQGNQDSKRLSHFLKITQLESNRVQDPELAKCCFPHTVLKSWLTWSDHIIYVCSGRFIRLNSPFFSFPSLTKYAASSYDKCKYAHSFWETNCFRSHREETMLSFSKIYNLFLISWVPTLCRLWKHWFIVADLMVLSTYLQARVSSKQTKKYKNLKNYSSSKD